MCASRTDASTPGTSSMARNQAAMVVSAHRFCGSGGWLYAILVDPHSKWMEAVPLRTSTAGTTLDALRTLFSTFRLPRTIATDNGPEFSSREFQTFTASNGIKHMHTAPYHPQLNGLAERAVHTINQSLQKNKQGSMQTWLARILHNCR